MVAASGGDDRHAKPAVIARGPDTRFGVGGADRAQIRSWYEKRFTCTDLLECVNETTEETAVETAEEIGADGLSPAVLASVGSVALALYFYYVRGDKQRGQFVGFWPVTILALASYFKLEEIKQMLAESEE